MKKIIAVKQKMSQIFDDSGNVVPVTLVAPKKQEDLEIFGKGEKVNVRAKSKGKGFQGVVKRHGFHGGPRTHGQKHSEREPGSIGPTAAQRVFKGIRMAGRMGGDNITVKNLKIVEVDKDKNQILISGAIPGHKGTIVEVYES